jgi:hypothetical protein
MLISATFGWLSVAMRFTIAFLLSFIGKIVRGLGSLVQSAGVAELTSGATSGISTTLGFSFQTLISSNGCWLPGIRGSG